jgi:hypothetical protein
MGIARFLGLGGEARSALPARARRQFPDFEPLEDRVLLSTLTVVGSQHLQTISGFGTNLNADAWNSGAVGPSLTTLFNHGFNLYRVIVEPVTGWEDTNPNTGQYSDSNPNWAFYNNLYGTSTKFTNLWNTIRYLNSEGATVWVNLQSDAPAWMTDAGGSSGSLGQDHENDWATMVSTMMDYAINTAHVHIDALGPMNEPDNHGDPSQGPQVGATQYVQMLDMLETQLQGYGLGNIPLVGPDATFVNTAVSSYDPAMLADSFLMPHVLQFGYHTYGGTAADPNVTNSTLYPGRQIISDEYDGNYYEEPYGVRASSAQLWTQADTNFQNLMAIVSAGENGAAVWDGVDSYYEYNDLWSADGVISYNWTASNPTAPSDYGTTPRLYEMAQMAQFVAPGSIVIGSSTNASNVLELAFMNPNGRISIVGENTGTSTQSITGTLTGGLNASVFNMYETNSSLNEQQQANVTVTSNTFSFSVPADTIFTLTTPTSPTVTGVAPMTGITTGAQSVTITGKNFTGATSVLFGTVPASSFVVNSDSQITAITPPQSAATVDVTVLVPNGSSTITSADHFQYVAVNGTAAPTLAKAAAAVLAANQTSAALSVLGASQYGASTLTYTWATTGTPPAPVTFSTNASNGAQNVTATFSLAGNYGFIVTITDPAGKTITSTVSVTVAQVLTTFSVNPPTGTVAPAGTLQFSAIATDQFGLAYTATPISWIAEGGGTIDSTGKFTAGSSVGGPFTVFALAGGINAAASVTITGANLATSGTAYRWSALTTSTSNSNKVAAAGLNDGNLTTNVALSGGADDVANAYEAGGVLWSTAKTINRVIFTSGSFNPSSYDGVFDANLALQTTTDGTTWGNVSGWSFSPAYQYDMAAAAGVTYTFTGSTLSVLGVRVVGEVHSLTGNDSWYANATEIQAFLGSTGPSPAVSSISPGAGGQAGGTGLIITGSNFTAATGVWFGAAAASFFTVTSATQIIAAAPSGSAAATVDVTVTNANGTSATSAADRFAYVSTPSSNLPPLVGSTSSTGSATPAGAGTVTIAPAAPTGLSATAGDNQVSLSWSATTGATGYQIYRGISSGNESLLASATQSQSTYVDSTAANGTTYYYKITAVNSAGESPQSAEASATPSAPTRNITHIGNTYKSWNLATGTANLSANSPIDNATWLTITG